MVYGGVSGRKRHAGRVSNKAKRQSFIDLRVQRDLISPDIVSVKLKFSVDFATYSSLFTYNVSFRANNVHQPYASLATQQPTGFDQWMALYSYCYVSQSRVVAQFVNQDPAGTVNCYLQASESGSFVGDPNDQSNCIAKLLGPASGGNNFGVLKMRRSTKQIFGRDRSLERNMWNTSSSGPTVASDVWYWNGQVYTPVTLQSLNIASSFIITYYCHFFGRITSVPNSS